MDTVWPQPPPQMAPQFNAQNWLAQVRRGRVMFKFAQMQKLYVKFAKSIQSRSFILFRYLIFFQVGPIPAMPPGQLPGSLWDLHAKDMKTEQQILVTLDFARLSNVVLCRN